MTLRIDDQAHSLHSYPCGWTSPAKLVRSAVGAGLDGIALTDHNTMAGIEDARAAAPAGFYVIAAEEVDTPDGQIIGLFLDEAIDPWQNAETVLDEIHDQGGLAFAPHPFDAYREGLETIDELAGKLDAVEVLNSRCVRTRFNHRAEAFAREDGLPRLGGSDAHFAHEIGTAHTAVDLSDAYFAVPDHRDGWMTAVRDAILDGAVRPAGGRGSILNHAGTKLVKYRAALFRP
jgi:predicted metal-dependent phosphoesterase TrpH